MGGAQLRHGVATNRVGILMFLFQEAVLPLSALVVTTPTEKEGNLTLLVYADSAFSVAYRKQQQSLRCYAQHHGYNMVVEAGAGTSVTGSACNSLMNYFYRRHCLIGEFMMDMNMTEVDTILLLDSDMMALKGANSMEGFLSYLRRDPAVNVQEDVGPADLVFQERCFDASGGNSPEVTAGAYLARNSNAARRFLKQWALYEKHSHGGGFDSSDNGAIHLALLDALDIYPDERAKCEAEYLALTEDVMHLEPYFHFVACARKLLAMGFDSIGQEGLTFESQKDGVVFATSRAVGHRSWRVRYPPAVLAACGDGIQISSRNKTMSRYVERFCQLAKRDFEPIANLVIRILPIQKSFAADWTCNVDASPIVHGVKDSSAPIFVQNWEDVEHCV